MKNNSKNIVFIYIQLFCLLSKENICYCPACCVLSLPVCPGIDVHSCLNVGMTYPLLNIFDINTVIHKDTDTSSTQVVQVQPLVKLIASINYLPELL